MLYHHLVLKLYEIVEGSFLSESPAGAGVLFLFFFPSNAFCPIHGTSSK